MVRASDTIDPEAASELAPPRRPRVPRLAVAEEPGESKVLVVGSAPSFPEWPGLELSHVHTLDAAETAMRLVRFDLVVVDAHVCGWDSGVRFVDGIKVGGRLPDYAHVGFTILRAIGESGVATFTAEGEHRLDDLQRTRLDTILRELLGHTP